MHEIEPYYNWLKYYEEWFDEVEDGWIAAISFPEFIQEELKKYHLDSYINMGGTLQLDRWRTMQPHTFFDTVNGLIMKRLT